VLELGCGGGAVAAHLATAGYRVTGIDGHLSRALEAARRAPEARFLVHDLAHAIPWWPVNRLAQALLALENALLGRVTDALPGASLWFALRRL
jgi:hypothetical protein